MIVVDASVLTNAIAYLDADGDRARAAMARDAEWAAPEIWRAEVFSAVRGLVLGSSLTPDQGWSAVRRLPTMEIDTVTLDGLLGTMWALRDTVSGYDAAYVALAQSYGVRLVTADRRLARAALGACQVELLG